MSARFLLNMRISDESLGDPQQAMEMISSVSTL
jgi:hypothetical protein